MSIGCAARRELAFFENNQRVSGSVDMVARSDVIRAQLEQMKLEKVKLREGMTGRSDSNFCNNNNGLGCLLGGDEASDRAESVPPNRQQYRLVTTIFLS